MVGALKAMTTPGLAGVFVAMALYGCAVVWLLHRYGLWTIDLISETLFWAFGPGVVLLVRVSTQNRDSEGFFRKTLIDVIRITVVVEFLVNLYPMHLLVELTLVPILFFLGGMQAYAEHREKYQLHSCLGVMLLLVALAMLGNTVGPVIDSPSEFASADTGREFLLPIALTLAYVPFLFATGLYAAYGTALAHIRIATDVRRERRQAKLAVIIRLHLRAKYVRALAMPWAREIAQAPSFREALRKVDAFRHADDERRLAPIREQERLARFAGSDGEDAEGRRFDQREFKATRDALRWLQTAQIGWYRNRGDRYRPELLDVVDSRFQRAGLPEDHGITLCVAPDGQSWWAWRRTITGWCFGVGAKDPPPDEWQYDGPNPPKGPPGRDPAWSRFGFDCKNW